MNINILNFYFFRQNNGSITFYIKKDAIVILFKSFNRF